LSGRWERKIDRFRFRHDRNRLLVRIGCLSLPLSLGSVHRLGANRGQLAERLNEFGIIEIPFRNGNGVDTPVQLGHSDRSSAGRAIHDGSRFGSRDAQILAAMPATKLDRHSNKRSRSKGMKGTSGARFHRAGHVENVPHGHGRLRPSQRPGIVGLGRHNPKLETRNLTFRTSGSHSAHPAQLIFYFPHVTFDALVLVGVTHIWSSLAQRFA